MATVGETLVTGLEALLHAQIPPHTPPAAATVKGSLGPGMRCLIKEDNPAATIHLICHAWRAGAAVFLANEDWPQARQAQAVERVKPHAIWQSGKWHITENVANPETTRRTDDYQSPAHYQPEPDNPKYILPPYALGIATGGTTGGLKYSIHSAESLTAAAKRTSAFFGIRLKHSLSCLPTWHISGLMPWVRAAIQQGSVTPCCWKHLESGNCPSPRHSKMDETSLSLVPTQLERLMQQPAMREWLAKLNLVLIGGQASRSELIASAHKANIPVCPVYGMTETAAAVAAVLPQTIKQGRYRDYTIFPGVTFTLAQPEALLCLNTPGLHHGYWPNAQTTPLTHLTTSDKARRINASNTFRIIARADNLLNTGGEKVNPRIVEDAILKALQLTPLKQAPECHVFGIPDELWGQRIVAAISPPIKDVALTQLKDALKDKLARWEIPKKWLMLDKLPINEAGKIIPEELLTLVNPKSSVTEESGSKPDRTTEP